MVPSVATPWKRRRHGGKAWRLAIASTTMNPMLWRLAACLAPGLPRPTNSNMDQAISRRAGPEVSRDRRDAAYFFSGAAAAPAAGAAAAGAAPGAPVGA